MFEIEPADVADAIVGEVVQEPPETALARRATDLEARARDLVITDRATFVAAGQFLEGVNATMKEIERFFADDIARAHATWKGLTSKRASFLKPLETAYGIVERRYSTFDREDKARAERDRRERELAAQREEQERLRTEAAAREAEAKQIAENALRADSREEGQALEAQAEEMLAQSRELKVEAATVQAPVLQPERVVPTDTGPKVRANWTFEVTDKAALVKAVAKGDVSLEAVEPNDTYLRRRAQADKATCAIPGVRVYDAGAVTARRPSRSA